MTTINVLVHAFLTNVFFCFAAGALFGFFLLHGMNLHFFLLSVYFPTRSKCFLNVTGAILRINLKTHTNNHFLSDFWNNYFTKRLSYKLSALAVLPISQASLSEQSSPCIARRAIRAIPVISSFSGSLPRGFSMPNLGRKKTDRTNIAAIPRKPEIAMNRGSIAFFLSSMGDFVDEICTLCYKKTTYNSFKLFEIRERIFADNIILEIPSAVLQTFTKFLYIL